MSDNCEGFETYTERLASGAGNKLEWMDLFRDYQGMHVLVVLTGPGLWCICIVNNVRVCVCVCVCIICLSHFAELID